MPGLVATFESSSILYDTLSLPDSSEAAVAPFLQNADILLAAAAWKTKLNFHVGQECRIFFLSFYVGDAGNTSLVDAGTPLGATAVVTPGSAGYVLWECCTDLFPTAEGCEGSSVPNVTMLHWAQLK